MFTWYYDSFTFLSYMYKKVFQTLENLLIFKKNLCHMKIYAGRRFLYSTFRLLDYGKYDYIHKRSF